MLEREGPSERESERLEPVCGDGVVDKGAGVQFQHVPRAANNVGGDETERDVY